MLKYDFDLFCFCFDREIERQLYSFFKDINIGHYVYELDFCSKKDFIDQLL